MSPGLGALKVPRQVIVDAEGILEVTLHKADIGYSAGFVLGGLAGQGGDGRQALGGGFLLEKASSGDVLFADGKELGCEPIGYIAR